MARMKAAIRIIAETIIDARSPRVRTRFPQRCLMSLIKWTLAVATLSTVAAMSVSAQNAPAGNPLVGNADAIRFGTGLYRSRCADCHGMDGRGVRAPDLTQ